MADHHDEHGPGDPDRPGARARLAVYGSLAPGAENARVLRGIRGVWKRGRVRGTRIDADPAAGRPYPVFVPRGSGVVDVLVFESPELERHLARIDAFEGEDYRRIVIDCEIDGAVVPCFIYAGNDAPRE